MRKLLLIGSDSIHTYNYYQLIEGYFDDILLITQKGENKSPYKTIQLDFSLRNIFTAWQTIKAIQRLIENFKPSVIHIQQANSFSLLTLIAAKKFKIPTIITALGSDILLNPHKGWFYKKMVKYNLNHAGYFTSDSEFMADEMRRLIPEKNLDITLANFGINITTKDVPKENLIYSNRLHKKLYRIDKIIEAFGLFYKSRINENWTLVIAGIGEETEILKEMVVKLHLEDHVKFIGWVNVEVNADYYSRAKIFVSIPESDATSISLLEAMAAGCIPVLSYLPANKEWIKDNFNGIIVQNLNENFIERALHIDNKAIEINKKTIAEKGTKEANRLKFLTLYNRILSFPK